MDAREVLTPAEAAELLQVHVKTVYKWIETGELRSAKLGPRSTRILKSDLMQFVESKTSTLPPGGGAGVAPAPQERQSPESQAIEASRLALTRCLKRELII